MKTILVATDFSPSATNAVAYATDMALAINADLFLLHVCSIPVSYTEMPMSMNVDEFLKSAQDEMVALKESITWQTSNKLSIETKVIAGSFFQELKDICEEIIPYAVVMGSQGTSAAERFAFGGHTIHAMKHLMWPLITVPLSSHFSSIKIIGWACDFKEAVDTAVINEISKLVGDFKSKLCILNTGRQDVFDSDVIFQSELLQEKLKEFEPVFEFVSSNDTDQGILDFVEQHQIDLLVVLPKRHSLLDIIIHKSHTKQFVLHCQVPVMALTTAVEH